MLDGRVEVTIKEGGNRQTQFVTNTNNLIDQAARVLDRLSLEFLRLLRR
jgi:hypothetical protein